MPRIALLGGLAWWTAVAVGAAEGRGSDRPAVSAPVAREASAHRFSTTVKAQEIRDLLGDEAGLEAAVDWCRDYGVAKVYLETFRYNYLVDRALMERVRARFAAAGIEVSGLVTPTNVGKPSTGWNVVCCFTDPATQERLAEIFEFTASLFDEILIDDFLFTDCACSACGAARRARSATVGGRSHPVAGDAWSDYRGELLFHLARERILAPVRRVNPKAHVIVKFPRWYEGFQDKGYDVVRGAAAFDATWVGTETRDYGDKRWGGVPPYAAFFLMRWLGGIGGPKCGGAWFDPLGTTEATYVEQARQTILGGARETILHSYGYLKCSHIEASAAAGPKDMAALRAQMPELLVTAAEVARRRPVGIAAWKPVASSPGNEAYVFDFVGMLGFPLAPCHEFPANAPAAFFPTHALKDADLAVKLSAFIASGRPVLVTDGLAKRMEGRVALGKDNVRILRVNGAPKSLLAMPQTEVDALRAPFLKSLGHELRAPVGVGLYLFDDGSWVVENFNDQSEEVVVDGAARRVAARGWLQHWVAGRKP